MLDQVHGNVRDDDLALRANTIEGTEGDEAVATPHVQQVLTWFDAGVVKDAIADRQEVLERLLALQWIITIATVHQP